MKKLQHIIYIIPFVIFGVAVYFHASHVALINKQDVPEGWSDDPKQAIEITDTSHWKSFITDPHKKYAPHFVPVTFEKTGFRFQYPNDWTIGYANPSGIVELYTPEVSQSIARCKAEFPKQDWDIECGRLMSDIVLLIPDGYQTFSEKKDRIIGLEYTQLNLNGHDVFVGTKPNDSSGIFYHVNFPDKTDGLEFRLDMSHGLPGHAEEYKAIALAMLKSLQFFEVK